MTRRDTTFRSSAMPGVFSGLALVLFFLTPFVIVLAYSFYHKISGGLYEPAFEIDNYRRLLSLFFGRILLMTTGLCALASMLALSLGFPLTYAICRMTKRGQTLWLILLVSLLSLSEVIIGFAWSTLFSRTAGIGQWLFALGLLDAPRAFAPGFGALLTALTFICIPFVVLVLYAPMSRLPRELAEAARTLGANALRAVLTVVVPSLRTTLLAAFVLAFIYSLGSYVLPSMLGRPRHWTLSVHITDQAVYQSNLPFAAALSMFLIVAALTLIVVVNRLTARASSTI